MEPLDIAQVFPNKTDGQVVYTGPSVPELGIKQGDTVAAVLSTLFTHIKPNISVAELETRLGDLTVDDLITTAPTLDLGGQSSAAAAQIFNKGFNYVVSEDGNFTKVEYSMKDTTDNMPDGFRVISTGLSIQGAQSRSLLVSTTGSSGEVKVLPNQFPVLLNLRVGVNSPSGDIKLTKTVSLQAASPTTGGGSLLLEDLSSTTESFLTQKEFNTRMSSELSKLKQRIEDIEQNGT